MHTTLVFELCSLFLVRDFIILVEIVSNFTVCIWRTLLSNWIKIHTPYSIPYNTCGYFASRVVFFRTPQGGEGEGKYEQWAKCPLVFYAKPSNKRFIIPPQKKDVILQLASIFLVRVFRNILIPSLRMTLTMSKMFARIICQSIEWKVNYSTAKNVILASIFYLIFVSRFVQFSHSCSLCIRRYSPCCKPVQPGHYTILRVLLTLYGKIT